MLLAIILLVCVLASRKPGPEALDTGACGRSGSGPSTEPADQRELLQPSVGGDASLLIPTDDDLGSDAETFRAYTARVMSTYEEQCRRKHEALEGEANDAV